MSEKTDQGENARRLKQALLAVQEMRARVTTMEQAKNEPIAVVGMGCRFPGGADQPEAFWNLLEQKVDAIREVPPDRWSIDEYYDADPAAPGKVIAREGGFLDDIDLFDAHFFGISPREAICLDPQQRLLLEVSWEALERAGIPADRLTGSSTGVFVGISSAEYFELLAGRGPQSIDSYAGSGNSHSIAAGRLSYTLGLQGPALAVDTACSSSLVAVHLACQSLRQGECDLALAGGVNVLLTPTITINHSRAGMLSRSSRCRAFDAGADGFVRSEGCGMVVLARLSEARRRGLPVRALIRGTAVNQDGRSNGLTAPNGSAQRALLRRALAAAQVSAGEIGYVEAHGTGTALGDPIEAGALREVLGASEADEPCYLGSVKTNLGHLEAAAGIAGLLKVVLALEHGQIPAHLHFRQLNPHLSFAGSRLRLPLELTPWPGNRRLAGVSSFGFGGTNAHVILEGAPQEASAGGGGETPRRMEVLALSARSPQALAELVRAYAKLLAGPLPCTLGELCAAANAGRSHFAECRLALMSDSLAGLRDQLTRAGQADFTGPSAPSLNGHTAPPGAGAGRLFFGGERWRHSGESGRPLRAAFLFTGQGSQYPQMGRELWQEAPVFREALTRCATVLERLLPPGTPSLLEILFPPADAATAGLIHETVYTQPALFSVEYALAELWRSWGIEPVALLGHSVGEYVAACVAGVFTLEEGLRLVTGRARLLQNLPREEGGMTAVHAPAAEVQASIAPFRAELSIAAINGPHQVVISGRRTALAQFASAVATPKGWRLQALPVSHAFHSPLVEPMLAQFEELASSVRFAAPRIDLISDLHGRLVQTQELAEPRYWRRHVREPVNFLDGFRALAALDVDAIVELGPRPVLLGLGRECLEPAETERLLWLPSLRPNDGRSMIESLAALYAAGARVDWAGFTRRVGSAEDETTDHRNSTATLLPTYPFQRQRHWFAAAPRAASTAPAAARQAEPRPAAYRICWEARPVSTPSRPAETSPTRWLILEQSDSQESLATHEGPTLGRVLATLLERHHGTGTCHLLPVATDGQWPAKWSDALAPNMGIIHFLASRAEETPGDAAERHCDATRNLLQRLVPALASLSPPPRLWQITRGAMDTGGETESMPTFGSLAESALWGFTRVVALEESGFLGGLIDLPSPAIVPQMEADALFAALTSQECETQMALRPTHDAGWQRFVRRLQPAPLAGETPPQKVSWRVRADSAYLITGGLGALGMHTARWLASRGARTLILMGRRGIPSPEQEGALAALAEDGVRVALAACDVSEESALRAALDTALTELGGPPLRGIVHAAGLVGIPALARTLDETALREILRPKIHGAWALHRLERQLPEPLDFFICFSSVASVWGSKGQSAYAAANAFLDALCVARRREGRHALAVNWGPWLGGGMATAEARQWLRQSGVHGLEPADALALMETLLDHGLAQGVVAAMEWEKFRTLLELTGPQPLFTHLSAPASPRDAAASHVAEMESAILQALRCAPFENERLRLLGAHLQEELAAVLGFPGGAAAVPAQSGFFDLGMDSLMALDFRNRLATALGLSLKPTIAFDFPNVERLARHLLGLLDVSPLPAEASPASAMPEIGADALTSLSEAEAEALLLKKLEFLSTTLR